MSFLFGRRRKTVSSTNLQQATVALVPPTPSKQKSTTTNNGYGSSTKSQTISPSTVELKPPPTPKLQKSTSLLDVLKQKITRRHGHSLNAQEPKINSNQQQHTSSPSSLRGFWRKPSKVSSTTIPTNTDRLANEQEINKKYEAIKAKYYDHNHHHQSQMNPRQQSNLRISCLANGYTSQSYPSSTVKNGFNTQKVSIEKSTPIPVQITMTSTQAIDIPAPGEVFLSKLDEQCDRLQDQCRKYEQILLDQEDGGDKEELCGNIQAAIGQAKLLMAKRMEQFRQLCYENICPSIEKPPTTENDLAGYWDVMKTQIDSCNRSFDNIERMMANGDAKPNEEYELETLSSSGSSVGNRLPPKPTTSPATTVPNVVPTKSKELRKLIREKRRKQREEAGEQVADI